MELIYIWIEKYRTFETTEINLSDKFLVEYDKESKCISIEENKKFFNIYPNTIVNVAAFLGKNGVGKSNLLDLIGMRINDRNNLKEERDITYKYSKSNNVFKTLKIPQDIDLIQKKSKYFMVYYIGRNENGINEFCFEGNDIEEFKEIIENKEKVDAKYFDSKYWFSVICTYDKNRFFYVKDVSHRIYGETKSIQDKTAIILFRDDYDSKYFNYYSKKSDDESKIAIPRRISSFKADAVYKQIEFLVNQLKNENRHLYKKDSYILKINYDIIDDELETEIDLTNFRSLQKYYKELVGIQKNICDFSHAFTLHFLNTAINHFKSKKVIIMRPLNFKNDIYDEIKKYHFDFLLQLIENYLPDQNHLETFVKKYNETIELFENIFLYSKESLNTEATFNNHEIIIKLTKDTNTNLLNRLLSIIIDERFINEMVEGEISLYSNFFYYDLSYLSDGERAYLGLMSSIDEQISIKTQVEGSINKKENYILLFDEPETKMHPELARTFLKELIDFLQQYEGKKFQILISSHSPYLISDIPKNNIVAISKEQTNSVIQQMDIDTFAQNIHTISKEAFFMNATMGEYSKYKVQQINNFLDSNEHSKKQLDEAEYVINLIGEHVIKAALQDKLRTKKSAYQTRKVEEAINLYNSLSTTEKEDLIKYIISTQEGGEDN